MKVYIQKIIDYTLRRKGEKRFLIVDENGEYVNMTGGYYRSLKAAKNTVTLKGFEFMGVLPTVHQNYEHWADFEFAK